VFAALLPGIRELRAPLAAGYIWLVVVYLAVGAPDDIGSFSVPIEHLVDLLSSFGTLALGTAVSFVAYLIGSISQDAFGRLLLPAISRIGVIFTRMRLSLRLEGSLSDMEYLRDKVRRLVDEDIHAMSDRQVTDAIARDVSFARKSLREAQAAGMSQEEKPEAERPMIEAEGALRLAIVPPTAALMVVLSFDDSAYWLLGLLFVTVLFFQAAARKGEAQRLSLQHRHVETTRDIDQQLSRVADRLREKDIRGALSELGNLDIDPLRDTTAPRRWRLSD
jgi:hypothetical protein